MIEGLPAQEDPLKIKAAKQARLVELDGLIKIAERTMAVGPRGSDSYKLAKERWTVHTAERNALNADSFEDLDESEIDDALDVLDALDDAQEDKAA